MTQNFCDFDFTSPDLEHVAMVQVPQALPSAGLPNLNATLKRKPKPWGERIEVRYGQMPKS